MEWKLLFHEYGAALLEHIDEHYYNWIKCAKSKRQAYKI